MINKLFQHRTERSSASHAILEGSSRQRKAAKIYAVLDEVIDFSNASVLDIGTGSGHIAHELSKYAKKVTSVDLVDERKEKKGYTFKLAKDETLPFKDNTFDIVVTNHTVEHTPDQDKHLSETLRVTKLGGCIYLATPNKLWLTDPHYKLPFISWLPRKVSNRYLQAVQNVDWDVYPISASGIKKHFKSHDVRNALPLLVVGRASERLDTWKTATTIAKYVPGFLLNFTQYISPTLIFLIKKVDESDK